jgi:hypothetical protein
MWRRWTCCLAAVLLISACSHGTLTRVVRTDGTTVVGELSAARPDAVVLKLADGSTITIPRSIIRTIEAADAPVTTVAKGSGAPPPASGGTAKPASATAPATTPGPAHGTGTVPATTTPASTPTATVPPPTTPGRAPASGPMPGPGSGPVSGPGSTPANPPAATASAVASALAPSGTMLELTLSSRIGSDSSSVDDRIEAVLRAPILINGELVLEAGAVAHGVVTEATPSEKAEGRGRLTVRFDSLQLGARTVAIQTAPVRWEAPGVTRPPPSEPGSGKKRFFDRVVDKTKKGLHIGDEKARAGATGTAEVHVGPGAIVRVRLEQPTRIAP